jgi:probable HAF family extracellular repeat protein
MADVNNLVDKAGHWGLLYEATGINDLGQIIGTGFASDPSGHGVQHAFLLSPTNVASVAPATSTTVTVQDLKASFSSSATPGVLQVQHFTSESQLPADAQSKLFELQVFLGTLQVPVSDMPIWDVTYTGVLNGPLTLTFNYDPTITLGLAGLKIAHFNSVTQHWDVGGAVDLVHHTITFTTTSLSPFMLVAVPEPSTAILSAIGLLALTAVAGRKRSKQRCLKFN